MTLKKKLILVCFILSVIWLAVVLFSLSAGTYELNLFKDFNSFSDIERKVFFGIRLPRILMASIAGGTLAVCGAALQAMFRNPLAYPFTFGVSGGEFLGALVAIR